MPAWAIPVAVGATAAVIGVGAWVWMTRHRRNYVGSGWDWPKRNRFPTEESFAVAFKNLGYGSSWVISGWGVLSEEAMEVVRSFQRDFNEVRIAYNLQILIEELDADGLIGQDTIQAIEFALEQNERPNDSWSAVVQDARTFNAGVS